MKKFDYKIFNVNHKFTVLGVPYELIICDEDNTEYGPILGGRSNFHDYRSKKILLHNHVSELLSINSLVVRINTLSIQLSISPLLRL